MYCIDGVRTLKDCKPALTIPAVKQGQKKYAKAKTFGVNLASDFTNFVGQVKAAANPKLAVAYC